MKAIMNVLAAAALVVAVSACALLQPIGRDDDARRAAKVTLTAYQATQQAILIYGRLPTCDAAAGVTVWCKQSKLWSKIKVVEKAATQAINEATPVLNGTEADAGQLVAALIAIDNVRQALREAQTQLKGPTS